MEFVIFIVTICIIYFVLWFFDSFFKSCMFYPYDALLRGTGLTIRFLYIQWHTTAINRSFIKWANYYPKLFTLSFNIGIYVALILMPISFILHLLSLITSLSSSSMQSTTAVGGIPSSSSIILDDSSSSSSTSSATSSIFNNIELEIMLPGINLPLNEIIYYILALGICSITHEIGHAIAAILEDVAVTGFGIKIFFILPIAYTELNIDSLNSLKFWKKLRILCAGIWHNIVLSILCYLIFSISTTILLKPFYQINNAVIITQIHPNSPLLDKNYNNNNNNNNNGNGIGPSTGDNNLNINRGLKIGDVITEINSCRIKNIDSWYDCLLETIKIQPNYCIQSDFILNNDESVHDGGGGVGGSDNNNFLTECCDKKNIKNLCYEYVPDSYYSMSELPQFMCLNIRLVIENSLNYCHHKDERNLCKKENSYCIKPVINNSTTIIHIRRHDIFDKISPTITAAAVAAPTDKTIDQQQQQQQNKLIKQDVIYIGHPYDLSNTIKISEYIPKTNFLSANVADSFILLLKYCIVFSLGLAVVNILPIFNFDGQHIMQTILNHYLQPIVPERKKREQFSIIIISIGTIFLIISILKILWISILRNLL